MLITGMDFWGQVWKRVWEMAFFGLKLGVDLELRAAHPTKIPRSTPPPPGLEKSYVAETLVPVILVANLYANFKSCLQTRPPKRISLQH